MLKMESSNPVIPTMAIQKSTMAPPRLDTSRLVHTMSPGRRLKGQV